MDVGRPGETAFVAFSCLIGQHCDQDGVWMDSGAVDVVCVSDSVEYVFRVILGVAWWEDLGGGGVGGGGGGGVGGGVGGGGGGGVGGGVGGGGGVSAFGVRAIIQHNPWFDDSDFCGGEFA